MKTAKQQTYEHFEHRRLWAAAKAQWEIIPKAPAYKEQHYRLSAILLMMFAFEGFCNWLLSICVPDIWSNERKFFTSKQYRGTTGKCRYITELLEIQDWQSNERPINTVREVETLRDRLVHPKPESGSRRVSYDFPEMPPAHIGQVEKRIKPLLMERTREDFEEIANRMKEETEKKWSIRLGTAKPFCGLLGVQSTEM
ncbi:MAG: hypothetical protein AB7E95_05785 [Kiritimatiellales bacterium]